MSKATLFNDPVYGFIAVPSPLIFSIIEEPLFQRLRRIKQMGMADFVYPGALHTRFHHALGAMHLMGVALNALRRKGHDISEREFEAASLAILLHDVGHGPFSHALEAIILHGVHHEELSYRLMQYLNQKYDGALEMAVQMFSGTYPRRFFHQLVSSQLDIDRLDYLKRDCFYTGVSEGTIGVNRIIQTLNVVDNRLVVDEKGVYSIEHFLNARRLMYWQVYLHKTAVSVEQMIVQVIRRARFLAQHGASLFATPAFSAFIQTNTTFADFDRDPALLEAFTALDDHDVWASLKMWTTHPDYVLSTISRMVLERRIFKVILSGEKLDPEVVRQTKARVQQSGEISDDELTYFVVQGIASNAAYLTSQETINVLTKTGKIVDIAQVSDLPNIKAMSRIVKKYYLCWPSESALRRQR